MDTKIFHNVLNLKSFGVKTALTPIEISFFSSTGGMIPPTITGIFDRLFFFSN